MTLDDIEAAIIAAQGDEDGIGLEIAYWPEFPEEPWSVHVNERQTTGARLGDVLMAALRPRSDPREAVR